MSERIDVFNPFAPTFQDVGVAHVLANTPDYKYPFLHILGARWFTAQQSDTTGLTKSIWDVGQWEAESLIVVDHFLPFLYKSFGSAEALAASGRKIFVNGCLPTAGTWHESLGMNVFMSARMGRTDTGTGFSYEQFQNDSVRPIPIIPMGCGASWLPAADHNDKIIFLDEPHDSLLREMQNGEDDIRVRLFRHALETCAELSRQGFRIVTFARDNAPLASAVYADYDFLEVLNVGGWIPFSELAGHYSGASLFFSFFTETHGYPIYENMQLGNGIVTYAETFDAFRLRPMQRGALLSVYNSPGLSAALVMEYFDRYVSCGLRQQIRADANRAYSCETYFARLRKSAAFHRLLNDESGT